MYKHAWFTADCTDSLTTRGLPQLNLFPSQSLLTPLMGLKDSQCRCVQMCVHAYVQVCVRVCRCVKQTPLQDYMDAR